MATALCAAHVCCRRHHPLRRRRDPAPIGDLEDAPPECSYRLSRLPKARACRRAHRKTTQTPRNRASRYRGARTSKRKHTPRKTIGRREHAHHGCQRSQPLTTTPRPVHARWCARGKHATRARAPCGCTWTGSQRPSLLVAFALLKYSVTLKKAEKKHPTAQKIGIAAAMCQFFLRGRGDPPACIRRHFWPDVRPVVGRSGTEGDMDTKAAAYRCAICTGRSCALLHPRSRGTCRV